MAFIADVDHGSFHSDELFDRELLGDVALDISLVLWDNSHGQVGNKVVQVKENLELLES